MGVKAAEAGGGRTARVRAAVASARGERTARTMAVDALAVLASLTNVLLGIDGQRAIWELLPAWWVSVDVGLGLLATAALWWRRRHPVLVAAVLAVVGGVIVSAGAAAIIAVYTVASLRRTWIAVALTLAHLAIAIPYFLVVPVPGLGTVAWIVIMVLLYGITLAIGLVVRTRRQLIAGIVDAAEAEQRQQHAQLERARDAERARIAREMHDVLAHRLSLLSVHAGALEHRTRPEAERPPTPDEVRKAAAVIRSSAHTALEDLRDVLSLLGSSTDDELGTAAPQPSLDDLDDLVAESLAAGQRVRLQVDGRDRLGQARPQLQRTTYRIVQESLTNARKHAPGALVEARVRGDEDSIRVCVTNAVPVGITPSEMPGSGTGLAGLSERVQVEDGRLEVDVRDGCFVLTAELPWRE